MDARARLLVAAALLLAALGAGYVAYAEGQLEVGLFLIIPFVVGRGPWALAAIVLLVTAFIAFVSASMARLREAADFEGTEVWRPREADAQREPRSAKPSWADARRHEGSRSPEEGWAGAGEDDADGAPNRRVRGGGVVMIGPIPILFASSPRTAVVLIVLTLLLMLVAFLMLGALAR